MEFRQPARNWVFASVVVALSGVMLLGSLALPAFAADPTLTLTPSSGAPGTVLTLSGSGYPPPPADGFYYCIASSIPPTHPTQTTSCLGGSAAASYLKPFTTQAGDIVSGVTLTIPSSGTCGTAGQTCYVLVITGDNTVVVAHASFTVTTVVTTPEFPIAILSIIAPMAALIGFVYFKKLQVFRGTSR